VAKTPHPGPAAWGFWTRLIWIPSGRAVSLFFSISSSVIRACSASGNAEKSLKAAACRRLERRVV
jgi:hypothetical protein